MSKVLVAGASGHVGFEVVKQLLNRGYEVRGVGRSVQKLKALQDLGVEIVVADAQKPRSLQGVCEGCEFVISCLGRSVSLNVPIKASFREVDYFGNVNLLEEAKRAKIQKFIYLSVFGAADYPDLAYFRAHAEFEEHLVQSGMPYAIVRPVGIFSAFRDMLPIARKGRMAVLDGGFAHTNPIHEKEVAQVLVEALTKPALRYEIGGSEVLRRLEMSQIILEAAGQFKSTPPSIPTRWLQPLLTLLRWLRPNLHELVAFYVFISTHDCVAPSFGEEKLAPYLKAVADQT